MKNKLLLVSLIILPLLLLILEIYFKQCKGEYFLYDNYDGPYTYLTASLNIAQNIKPGYCHHPGIPGQILGALVVKFNHLLQGNDSNIVNDVFNRPEFYLNRINFAYSICTVISLFVLGYVTFRKTGSFSTALFIQLTPFIAELMIYMMVIITPDPFLITLILIFLTVIVSYMNEQQLSVKKEYMYLILFGFSLGLILATRISMLPMLIIPFLLFKKYSHKIFFVIISLITYSVLFLMFSSDLYALYNFVYQNITHSGKYGSGPSNFIDMSRLSQNLSKMFSLLPLFCISYLLIPFILLLRFIPKYKKTVLANRYYRLLIGIFIFMSAVMVIYLKQYEIYYLMPAILFSVISLYAVNSILSELFPGLFKFSKLIYVYIIFIVFLIPQSVKYKNSVKYFNNRKEESYKILKYLESNYPDYIVISGDRASSLPAALYSGMELAGSEEKNYVSNFIGKYPKFIYYEPWGKKFKFLNYNETLNGELQNSKKIIFHSFNEDTLIGFKAEIEKRFNQQSVKYEELYSNNNKEKLILVSID